MTVEWEFYERGVDVEAYMEQMTDEAKKEGALAVYQKVEMTKTPSFYATLVRKPVVVLVITEDWCGDAMMNVPILRRLAELAQIDVRVVLRDEDVTLIDRHLTNGGRSIPIFLALDQEGKVIQKWGPRARVVQRDVEQLMSELPEKEDLNFEEKRQEAIRTLTHRYATSQSYWRAVHDELVDWLASCN